MDLISPRQLIESNKYLQYFGGETFAKILFRILKLDQINEAYSKHDHLSAEEFVDAILQNFNFSYQVTAEDLERIPKTGNFITVSNHGYGGLDGVILLKVIPSVRPDFKVLVNFLLTKINPLKSYFLGVNPFETYKDVKSSFGGLKDAMIHIKNGHPIGIFPAGEVSSIKLQYGGVADKEWQHSILKFIKRARVPIIPIYFDGHNSLLFNILGLIHPVLRTIKLPSELLNKKGRVVPVRIGSPISVKEQDEFEDIREYGRMLRMNTYALGYSIQKPRKHRSLSFSGTEEVVAPGSWEQIQSEIESIKEEFCLFRMQNNSIFCAPSQVIPNVLKEIGRLREVTYRMVGEGTNRSIDLDLFDRYFEQLFIWDEEEKKIVGGYRVGKGRKIMEEYGVKGFYIHSLFHMDEEFSPVLSVSMELGRSFIVKEYQKKALSLFLLWKGILLLLLKHPEYRYLIGPVSISNEFKDLSKGLIAEFLKTRYYNSEFAEYIHPDKPFYYKIPGKIRKELFLKYIGKDLSRLDRFIQNIDPVYKTPVLLKKYLSVNAEIIGFNIDPNFNYCLDALMILDLFEVPFDTIESLSKEINDQSILDRFKKDPIELQIVT